MTQISSQYTFTVPGAIVAPFTGLTVWGIGYLQGPISGFSNIETHTLL